MYCFRYLIENGAPTHEAMSLFVARLGRERGDLKDKTQGREFIKIKVLKFIRLTHRNKNLVGKLILWVHFLSSNNPRN